ncbi:MAG: sigma-70 family RNA polymerase sigma factor [Terracidiphilus sp.]|jgi:RNA polymerase sigma-70 factor, ECF subfamily
MESIPRERPGERRETDELLVIQAQKALEGDLRAFDELVLRYQGKVVANCRYLTRDPNIAEDLAQEVLVKAYFGLRGFEGRSSFGHWLKRIKAHHCLNHVKKTSRQTHVSIEVSEGDEPEQLKVQVTAEQFAEEIHQRSIIGAVLDSLSSSLRIPLVLCDMDGLSYDEVAQSLGIGLSATKMRIKRGREEFRKKYENAQITGVKAIER